MPSIARRIGKLTCLSAALLALASCRLVISTDEGGHIQSQSGRFDCHRASCAYEIEDQVEDVFVAVPAEGYRFAGWEGICGQSPTATCEAAITPLPEEMSEFDGDAPLAAIFESTAVKRTWYRDRDGDNFGAPNEGRRAHVRPEGFALLNTDCDDGDPDIHPWTREKPDGVDNNCNGKVDERTRNARFYLDHDGDGYGDPAISREGKKKPRGYVRNNFDCDDSNAAINPGMEEEPDSVDNDCDGKIDNLESRLYRDVDGDGFGGSDWFIDTTEAVSGYVEQTGDCDDSNDRVHPGASETLDSVDNNCDGEVDEGFRTRNYYRDVDGDGFGDRADVVQATEAPEGYVRNPSDNCPSVYNPSQADVDGDGQGDHCDAVDNRQNDDEPGNGDSNNGGTGNTGGNGGASCDVSAEDQAMLDAVNAFRAQARNCGSRGSFAAAPTLTWSCQLEAAALGHSSDMASNNFFGHQGSNGSSPGQRISQAGYSWSTYGENIAAGGGLSVSDAMGLWVNSGGHCANIMNPGFRNLGAAKATNASSTYGTYWTQIFGRQ